jgi:hypothetical protein
VQRWCRATGRTGRAARASTRTRFSSLAVVVALGCGEQRGAPRVASRPSAVRSWERFEESRSWPLAVDGIPSAHGADEFVVRIRVAPAYRSDYLGSVAGELWPVGMAIAAFHERRGTRAAGSVYAMTKLAADRWEYVVSRADGVLEARGSIPLCVRCHAEARADSLFGPPSRSEESLPPASRSSGTSDAN